MRMRLGKKRLLARVWSGLFSFALFSPLEKSIASQSKRDCGDRQQLQCLGHRRLLSNKMPKYRKAIPTGGLKPVYSKSPRFAQKSHIGEPTRLREYLLRAGHRQSFHLCTFYRTDPNLLSAEPIFITEMLTVCECSLTLLRLYHSAT